MHADFILIIVSMQEVLRLSVVLPVYNKQNAIMPVFELLTSTLKPMVPGTAYELIFVDDGSEDNSWAILERLKADKYVKVIRHTTNLGQLKALETGLKVASGQVTIMTSCDLQNPLEQAFNLYAAVESGYDCALAFRRSRNEGGFKSVLSKLFLRLLARLFPKFPKGGFDFVAFSDSVKKGLLKNDFDKVFLQLELLKIAKTVYQIPVVRNADTLDSSGWSFKRRVAYALKAFKYLNKKRGE